MFTDEAKILNHIHHLHICLPMCTEGIDFIGPDPSVLTFTSGQSTGDIQCADVTILDNSILEGERSFSVELREVHSERSVKINETTMSLDIDVEDDPNDSKLNVLTVK